MFYTDDPANDYENYCEWLEEKEQEREEISAYEAYEEEMRDEMQLEYLEETGD